MAKKDKDEDILDLSLTRFSMSKLKSNSKVSFVGLETNHRLVFKQYRSYFDNSNQVKQIMDLLKHKSVEDRKNYLFVIDETCPGNKLDSILSYFEF